MRFHNKFFPDSHRYYELLQISDPLTTGGAFTSHTTYLVKSTLCPDGVRRRYSDFDWLRELLFSRFHGIAIPVMPEKRLVGNQSKTFIEERMAGLEQFCSLLVANPYLRLDATFRVFLTQQGTSEWEQAKKVANSGHGANPDSNSGLARWFGVLRQLPLPVDSDTVILEVQAATDELETHVSGALNSATKYLEAARASSEALRCMKDALNDWSTVSSASAAGLSPSLAPLKSHSLYLAEKIKKSADVFTNAHDLAIFSPNEIQMFLLDGLVTELQRIRSLKDLLALREVAHNDYTKAWVAQDKVSYQCKQFREKGREDKAAALEPKLAEAIGTMKLLKGRVDDITKGLIYIEADKLSRARVTRFIAMVGQYAALSIASGVRLQEIWTNFLGTMQLDQNTQVADAQATLTGQSSIHAIDSAPGSTPSLHIPTSVIQTGNFVPNAAVVVNDDSSESVPVAPPATLGSAMFTGSSYNTVADEPAATTSIDL